MASRTSKWAPDQRRRPPAVPRQVELQALLSSPDDRLAKRGLQALCDAIEAGHPFDFNRDLGTYELVGRLTQRNDQAVRLWLHKLIGLAKLTPLRPWLRESLAATVSPVDETWVWGFGAYSNVAGSQAAMRLADVRDPLTPSLELSVAYFRDAVALDPNTVAAALGSDDPGPQKWLSMHQGRQPGILRPGMIADLSTSSDNQVIEYAMWASHRDPKGSIDDLHVDPTTFESLPPNLRRWYLRVLLKEVSNLAPYSLIVNAALHDSSELVREALAVGLQEVSPLPAKRENLLTSVAAWYEREEDPLVLRPLRQLVLRNRRHLLLRDQAMIAERDIALAAGPSRAYEDRPARIFLPSHIRQRSPRLNPLPRVQTAEPAEVYVLGVDTVGFSQKTDRHQYQIFRDLIDAIEHDPTLARQRPEDLAILLTGDGFFLCFRGVTNRLAPIEVGRRLLADIRDLRKYNVRCGINGGPAMWITMAGGATQVISHAINWTARVMAAAGDGELLLDKSYYAVNVRPARDEFADCDFVDRTSETKAGEHMSLIELRSKL